MADNDRPKLGGAFRGSQDRTAGLSGLLPAGPRAHAPEAPTQSHALAEAPEPEPETTEPTTETPPEHSAEVGSGQTGEPASRTGGANRRSRRPIKRGGRSTSAPLEGVASAEDISRVVPIVLDAEVLERLREESRHSGQTHGLIALAAIEDNIDALSRRWTSTSSSTGRGGLFGRTQPQHRRTAPGVQSQLRLAAGDADVLDDLVARWSAPSRSALVNEALRLAFGAPASQR